MPPPAYLAGLDAVRVLALALVTAQHALTLLGRDADTRLGRVEIGQLGVALFLAVSGLLAADSRRPPVGWLCQRFRRLYPAYWVAVAASFALAAAAGHKAFGVGQVVSQMLGLGFFTHRDNLVNSPTWFVSLLLACYLGTFLARLARLPRTVGVAASVALAGAMLADVGVPAWLLSHGLTYAVAGTVALAPAWRTRAVVFFVGGCGLLVPTVQPAFAYPAVALGLVELASHLKGVPKAVRVAAAYSYEYYLVHGLALYGAVTALPTQPAVAIPAAIAAAGGAAVALHHQVAWVETRLERKAEPGRAVG